MKLVLLFSIVAVLAAPRGSAQAPRGTVELTPTMGAYVSVAPFVYGCYLGHSAAKGSTTPCTSPPTRSTALAVGVRGAVWAYRWMAVEGVLWYAPSSLEGRADDFSPLQRSSVHIVAGSVRIRAGVTPVPGIWAYVLGGPAVVALSGQSAVGAVIGVGARARLTAAIALRVEGEKYLYTYGQQAQPFAPDFAPEQKQRDLFVSLGLSVRRAPVMRTSPRMCTRGATTP